MITPQDFIHPEDESARRNMESIVGFSTAVKAFMKIGMEKYSHGVDYKYDKHGSLIGTKWIGIDG